jgi:hypothetical protein
MVIQVTKAVDASLKVLRDLRDIAITQRDLDRVCVANFVAHDILINLMQLLHSESFC